MYIATSWNGLPDRAFETFDEAYAFVSDPWSGYSNVIDATTNECLVSFGA